MKLRSISKFLVVSLSLSVPLLCMSACEGDKAVSLDVQAANPFKRSGASQKLRVTPKDKKGRPFVGTDPNLSAVTADASIVEVTADDVLMNIKVVARNGGKTKVTVSAYGLEKVIDIVSLIPGSVKITSKPKTKLRIGGKSHTLKVEVLDAKGEPLEGVPVVFSVSDYCVTVDSNGLVEPVASGACTVSARAGTKSATIDYVVR